MKPRVGKWMPIGGVLVGAVLAVGHALVPRRSTLHDEAVVARVNDEPVSTRRLTSALANIRAEARDLSTAEAAEDPVLKALVDEELLIQYALEHKLVREDPRLRRSAIEAALEYAQTVRAIPAPSETDLRAYFEAHRAELGGQPRYAIEHVFVRASREDGEVRARAAQAALRQGESIASVSAEYGDPAPATAPRTPLPLREIRGDLGPTVARAIEELAPGEVSEPVRASGGYTVVRLIDVVPGATPEFDDVRGAIRDLVARANRTRTERDLLDELRSRARVAIDARSLTAARPEQARAQQAARIPSAENRARP